MRGFTLIELMIVISIMGVLTAVAVPNYVRYVNKSKQNEAKVNLESLYAAEKSFYFNHLFYSPRFDAVGFKPAGSLNYHTGFAADSNSGFGTAGCIDTSLGTCTGSVWTEALPAQVAGTIGASNIVTTGALNSFSAEARGKINGAIVDIWNIRDTIDPTTKAPLVNTNPGVD